MRRIENAVESWVDLINMTAVIPVTPLDSGNLRKSQYVVKEMTINGFRVETGFKMWYAPTVHEWPQEGINWTTAGTGPKFLQNPYFSNAGSLRAYIVKNARIR